MVEKAIGLDAIFYFVTIITTKDSSTYRGLVWAVQSAF